jgi:hypothetical protein
VTCHLFAPSGHRRASRRAGTPLPATEAVSGELGRLVGAFGRVGLDRPDRARGTRPVTGRPQPNRKFVREVFRAGRAIYEADEVDGPVLLATRSCSAVTSKGIALDASSSSSSSATGCPCRFEKVPPSLDVAGPRGAASLHHRRARDRSGLTVSGGGVGRFWSFTPLVSARRHPFPAGPYSALTGGNRPARFPTARGTGGVVGAGRAGAVERRPGLPDRRHPRLHATTPSTTATRRRRTVRAVRSVPDRERDRGTADSRCRHGQRGGRGICSDCAAQARSQLPTWNSFSVSTAPSPSRKGPRLSLS